MLDITLWVEAFGILTVLALIGITVFAESGLLVGIFLPGDTLLIAVGVLAAQGHLPLALTCLVIIAAATIGDNVGYYIGRHTGHRIFKKRDGLFFRKSYALRAKKFFRKHGAKTVLFARFIPYVRTFAPMVAGVGHMDRRKFIVYNVAGAALWTVTTVLIGYWLGSKIPHVDNFLYLGAAVCVLFIIAPTLWHVLADPLARRRLGQLFAKAARDRRA